MSKKNNINNIIIGDINHAEKISNIIKGAGEITNKEEFANIILRITDILDDCQSRMASIALLRDEEIEKIDGLNKRIRTATKKKRKKQKEELKEERKASEDQLKVYIELFGKLNSEFLKVTNITSEFYADNVKIIEDKAEDKTETKTEVKVSNNGILLSLENLLTENENKESKEESEDKKKESKEESKGKKKENKRKEKGKGPGEYTQEEVASIIAASIPVSQKKSPWHNSILPDINNYNYNGKNYTKDDEKAARREKFNPEKSNKEENQIGGWSWIENVNSFKR